MLHDQLLLISYSKLLFYMNLSVFDFHLLLNCDALSMSREVKHNMFLLSIVVGELARKDSNWIKANLGVF